MTGSDISFADEADPQDGVIGTLTLLANAMADVEDRLTQRIDTALAKLEARLGEHMRGVVIDVGQQLYAKLDSDMADMRQIGHLASRKIKPHGSPIRCVFVVHAIEFWDAQVDIYEAMLRDARFDPLVVSIDRRFSGDVGHGGEEMTSAALDEAGVRHIRLGLDQVANPLDVLRALQPDVIFRQAHWDPDVPPAFAATRLNFARICSVPYGMSIVGKFQPSDTVVGGVNAQAFDQPYHRLAWHVFCETEQTRDYFTQFAHSDSQKFIVSGYPKLSRLQRAKETPKWPIAHDGMCRFRVVWAPHYSVGTNWLGFGTFDKIYREFLEWARERSDLDFVLKPHPALFRFAVKSRSVTQDELDAFLNDWQALPNCAIELGIYGSLFAASDMMVTDGLSFLTEYQIFEKPLVFVDSQRHVPMNALGDAALAAAHHVATFDALKAAVEGYAAGVPWAYEAQRQALLKTLLPSDRDPAEIILDAIADGLVANAQEA